MLFSCEAHVCGGEEERTNREKKKDCVSIALKFYPI